MSQRRLGSAKNSLSPGRGPGRGSAMCAADPTSPSPRRTVVDHPPRSSAMNGWFDVSKSKADEFFFVLKSGNGEVVMTSEMYTSRASADTGIASVQANSDEDFNYERATATDG